MLCGPGTISPLRNRSGEDGRPDCPPWEALGFLWAAYGMLPGRPREISHLAIVVNTL